MARKRRVAKEPSSRRSKGAAPARRTVPPASSRVTRVAALTWGIALSALATAAAIVDRRPVAALIVVAICAAAVWLVMRTERPGGCAAVICGIVGLTAGISFGPGHLTWAGMSWQVVAGLLLLAAGVVLLLTGIPRLLPGAGRRPFLARMALALIGAVAVWTLTPAVLATNPPHIPSGDEQPEDFGLTAREVHFVTSDGVELGAWYVPSASGAAVVLRHGAGSTSSDVLAHAAALANHGCGVLVTDARGHGMSKGRGMEFGWYGDIDIAAAVSFLLAQPDVDSGRIAAVGISMGGEEALGAAAVEPRIAAVVAEGAMARTAADKVCLADVYGWRGRIQVELERIQYWLADQLTTASPPAALADAVRSASPKPVLLITAGDVADEGHAAAFIKEQSPENVTIWTVPGASHTEGLTVAPVRWEQTVTDFLDAALA